MNGTAEQGDVLETIFRRISIRSYAPHPAAQADLEAVLQAGKSAETLTPGEMQFHLCTHEEMGSEVRGLFGNYGKIIRAPHYIVLAAREAEGYLTDAGFRFEQMVLEATRRGLGTCWVGLLFTEASLRSCLGLDASWRVIALTPLGLPADPTMVSRTLRALARSATRTPVEQLFFWQRHGAALPPLLRADDRIRRIMEATRWAPSWRNKQPWQFILTGREILAYKKRSLEREGKDYHLLDCGIAMAHLHLAARALGFPGRWHLGSFEIPGDPDARPIGRYPLLINEV